MGVGALVMVVEVEREREGRRSQLVVVSGGTRYGLHPHAAKRDTLQARGWNNNQHLISYCLVSCAFIFQKDGARIKETKNVPISLNHRAILLLVLLYSFEFSSLFDVLLLFVE
jgi:hypothetical protein